MATVLNLDTMTEMPVVVIDQQRYSLKPPDALSVIDYKRIERIAAKLQVLWNATDLTTEQEAELSQQFDDLCRIVLIAPAEVHGRLTDVQRVAIYEVFQKLPQVSLSLVGALAIKGGQQARRTGATSLRGSHGSMAATRRTGSRRRR